MKGDTPSRGVATLVALGVQGLVLLALGMGLGITPRLQLDVPTLSVVLLPVVRPAADMQAAAPVHVKLQAPDIPLPVVPVDIVLPQALPLPQPDAPKLADDSRRESTRDGVGEDSAIDIVTRVEPEYPPAAAARHAQGTALIGFLVDADGYPAAVRILHSSGDAQLDAAAVRAAQKWEFKAAMSHSHVVPRWARLEVNFNLSLYRSEHGAIPSATGHRDEADPAAALAAAIVDPRRQEMLSAAARRLLQERGPVRSIRFVGVAAHPPPGATEAELVRTAQDGEPIAAWNEFEMSQPRGASRWFAAVDAMDRIQTVLATAE